MSLIAILVLLTLLLPLVSAQRQDLCTAQLNELFTAEEPWALAVLDSWGRWPSGQFSGNQYDLGAYDQCRRQSIFSDSVGPVEGRYCLVVVPRQLNSTAGRFFVDMQGIDGVAVGMCFPKVCSERQLREPALQIVNSSFGIAADHVQVQCEGDLPRPGAARRTAIMVFTLIATLTVFSTIYDLASRYFKPKPVELWTTFSLRRNWNQLIQVRPSTGNSELIECIHGIRVLAIGWIILGHSYMMILSAPVINPFDTFDWRSSFHSALITTGPNSVDTFFVLSGLLTCWGLLKELDRNSKLNVPLLYLHRYLRLTPVFAALILFTVGFYQRIGDGPLWPVQQQFTTGNCEQYWWSALLYVQNYVNPNQLCIGHSWYLSVDMQLFLLSPLIIYPLWRWGPRVLIAVAVLILASMGCLLSVFLVNDLRASVAEASLLRDRLAYLPTHTRMGAWFVGLILGYVLHRIKRKPIQIPTIYATLGWLTSLAIMIACLVGAYGTNHPNSHQNGFLVDALYETGRHVLWACSVAWIIFACTTGYGGPINTLLSATYWQPFGKLSYCLYLLHLPMQVLLTGTQRTVRHFSDLEAIHAFGGDASLTVLASVGWTLLFEVPFANLDGSLRKVVRKKPASRTNEEFTSEERG
uniref:Nose resistant to fluoxetine protein 6 n=1 Tax=Culex pipiens TaxID=7175 RepID=A0A8D7ZYQ8_CULPI